ncbi:MAG: hypothetical protein RLZZ164_1148 [Actinomycetota bacterium]|jgi:hypothetical protein
MNFEHEHLNPNKFTDSAGTPWQGREFESNKWAGDDGKASPNFLASINAFQKGEATLEALIDVMRTQRFLIPLLADLGDVSVGAHGQAVDKSADLSIVTVATPDEQSALPVFSSVAAMTAWNASARPVPADARRIALAAASEGNTRVVIDAGSATEFVIRRPAIEALAKDEMWVHPVRDSRVTQEFAKVMRPLDQIQSFELSDGDPTSVLAAAELQVTIKLTPGLSAEDVQQVLQKFATALAESEIIAELVDSLRVKLA